MNTFVYTDASFHCGVAGLAVVVIRDGVIDSERTRVIDAISSVHAEAAAIRWAVELVEDRPMVIYTDSTAAMHRKARGPLPKGVRVEWVRGHAGSFGNRRADHLARCARRRIEPTRAPARLSPWDRTAPHGWTPGAADAWARGRVVQVAA